MEQCAAAASPSTPVDLRAVYKKVYETIPWPESIPSPGEVTLRWKRQVTQVLGSCYPYRKVITISPIYQDRRLSGEIADLMTHEAGHFIWQGHPLAFKTFLRSVGIAPHYIRKSSPPSAAFQEVWAEWSLLPSVWECPACGAGRTSTGGHLDVCCRRCARAWNPQLRLPLAARHLRAGHEAAETNSGNRINTDAGGR